MRNHDLSQHVHRIGFHFPSTIVATVCMNLGLSLTATGRVVPVHGVGGHPRSNDEEFSQIEINTEARDALRDLFPNIPDNDLNQIIKTAFQKVRGSNFRKNTSVSDGPANAKSRIGPTKSWYSP